VNLSRRHPIIVVLTASDIGFVLAAAAVVETLFVVVIPGSDVITVPPPVPGLTIETWSLLEAGAGVSSRPSP